MSNPTELAPESLPEIDDHETDDSESMSRETLAVALAAGMYPQWWGYHRNIDDFARVDTLTEAIKKLSDRLTSFGIFLGDCEDLTDAGNVGTVLDELGAETALLLSRWQTAQVSVKPETQTPETLAEDVDQAALAKRLLGILFDYVPPPVMRATYNAFAAAMKGDLPEAKAQLDTVQIGADDSPRLSRNANNLSDAQIEGLLVGLTPQSQTILRNLAVRWGEKGIKTVSPGEMEELKLKQINGHAAGIMGGAAALIRDIGQDETELRLTVMASESILKGIYAAAKSIRSDAISVGESIGIDEDVVNRYQEIFEENADDAAEVQA